MSRLFAFAVLLVSPWARQGSLPTAAFPAAAPEEVGLNPQALARLAESVKTRVAAGEPMGAELLVVCRSRTVLHAAWGQQPGADGKPLEPGALHAAGAVVAPLLGTLAQIAIDQGKLGLEDTLGSKLPAWAQREGPALSLRHLLTRRSGLGSAPAAASVRAAADELAKTQAPLAPGGAYNEAHAELVLLAALLEAAYGEPLEQVVRAQLLAPLGIEPSSRILDLAGTGAFQCSAEDAGRLLSLWQDKGRARGKRVLSRAALARALDPGTETSLASGLPGLELRGGQMWRLHVARDSEGARAEGFSAAGADGSCLWAWPERELLIVLLASSPGPDLRTAMEAAMQPLLPATYAASPVQTDFEGLLGLYWATEGDDYLALLAGGEGLLVELPGAFVLPLRPSHSGWKFQGVAWTAQIERDEQGRGRAVSIEGSEHKRRFERRPPQADLPSIHQVMEKKLAASGWAHLQALGTWRRVAALERSGSSGRGTVTSWVQGGRSRVDIEFGAARQTTWVHGLRAWQRAGDEPAVELDPVRAEQAALEHPAVLLSDWRLAYQEVEVLARGTLGEERTLIVRAVPKLSFATTYTLSETTWQVLRLQRVVWLPGFGNVGIDVRLSDYRSVQGVSLPFRSLTKYALPELGGTLLQVQSVDVGVEPPADHLASPLTPVTPRK